MAVTLTCRNGHTFPANVKPGGTTDCPACRDEHGERVRVYNPKGPGLRARLSLLPGPDDDPDLAEDQDIGEAGDPEPGPEPEPDDDDDLDVPDFLKNPPPPDDEPEAYGTPGHLRDKPAKGKPAPKKAIRITAAVRKDIEAKIRFIALPAGHLWEARDYPCGSTFVQQEPEISAALAEIVCDSPDLVAFFTSTAGGWMKWFRLAMACQPVVMMAYAHHISHMVVSSDDAPGQPDYEEYAA